MLCRPRSGASFRITPSIRLFAHEEKERPEEEREDVLAASDTGMGECFRDCPADDDRTEHERARPRGSSDSERDNHR